jgi:hypothetical protein
MGTGSRGGSGPAARASWRGQSLLSSRLPAHCASPVMTGSSSARRAPILTLPRCSPSRRDVGNRARGRSRVSSPAPAPCGRSCANATPRTSFTRSCPPRSTGCSSVTEAGIPNATNNGCSRPSSTSCFPRPERPRSRFASPATTLGRWSGSLADRLDRSTGSLRTRMVKPGQRMVKLPLYGRAMSVAGGDCLGVVPGRAPAHGLGQAAQARAPGPALGRSDNAGQLTRAHQW